VIMKMQKGLLLQETLDQQLSLLPLNFNYGIEGLVKLY
jgi:hypothetical protein